jgi:hypothetical protein
LRPPVDREGQNEQKRQGSNYTETLTRVPASPVPPPVSGQEEQ